MSDLTIREFVPEKNPLDMEALLPAGRGVDLLHLKRYLVEPDL